MCLGVMILIIELSRRNLKFAFVYRAFKKLDHVLLAYIFGNL